MTNKENLALLFKMIENLREAGNWTGETSIHKALYILQKLMGVSVKYEFTLYLHGPFSFDLREDLSRCIAYNLIQLEFDAPKYGPKHKLTDAAQAFLKNNQDLPKEYDEKIKKVCELINTSTVVSLEKLATALYVIKELNLSGDAVADKLCELKLHIGRNEAFDAVEKVNKWINEVEEAS